MSYVDKKVKELRDNGFYGAEKVDPDVIKKILNMDEWIFYGIDTMTLESYLGLLAQQVMYIQQEVNIAEAREIELGNSFKIEALPLVIDSKIRSVEERWIFASTLTENLKSKYDLWQQSIMDYTLKKKLSEPLTEKLLVLKKIYDERRMEGKNSTIHKQNEGN
ncbi:MAG TPA: hypothetical protein VKU94_06190 [Geobacterales bacterium]|nr:hypothetical protein [Geobacterales bacterium]